MKHAIELREDLIVIRDGASNGSSKEDIIDALDQIVYEIDMDEMQDLENFLIEADFNATFGNGINPYAEGFDNYKDVPF